MTKRRVNNTLSFRQIMEVSKKIEELTKDRKWEGPQQLADALTTLMGYQITPHNVKNVVKQTELDVSYIRSSTGMAGVLRGFKEEIETLKEKVATLESLIQG